MNDLDLCDAAGRTELANGKRLSMLYGRDLRYCPALGWMYYTGKRWEISETQAQAYAKQTAEIIWGETGSLLRDVEPILAKEIIAFARDSSKARGIANMLTLAQSEPGIPISTDKLDCHPWLLNCDNGTIDLKSSELLPHKRQHYLTKLCPTPYDKAATCPQFQAFLKTIFAGDQEKIRYIQRLLGCAIVGKVIEHILPIFHGMGANGKSVLIETIIHTLGDDFASKLAPDLLMSKKGETHPTERADLRGKRLVIAQEPNEGKRLDEGLVKEATGGDTMKARFMRQDFFSFVPSHTAILVTNHRPIVRGTDNGIWRRLRLIPFTVTIPPDQQDTGLTDKLKAEAPGILNWLVEGCLMWQREGLNDPQEVLAATADYRGEQDVIGEFLNECTVEGVGFKVKAGGLYAAYVAWCNAQGEYPKNNRAFGEAMTERGCERYRNNGWWYRNVGLLDDGPNGPNGTTF